MVTITLKNIPDKLHQQLKKQAGTHRRSLNGEILACLEKSAQQPPIDIDKVLERARSLRDEVSGRLTNQKIRSFKNEGRP